MKFGVGVMLTSFGIFWSGEGAGIEWPGGDASLVLVVGFVARASLALVARRAHSTELLASTEGGDGVKWHPASSLKFWYDFIVGDDWRLAIGVVVIVGVVVVAGAERVQLVVASARRRGVPPHGVSAAGAPPSLPQVADEALAASAYSVTRSSIT